MFNQLYYSLHRRGGRLVLDIVGGVFELFNEQIFLETLGIDEKRDLRKKFLSGDIKELNQKLDDFASSYDSGKGNCKGFIRMRCTDLRFSLRKYPSKNCILESVIIYTEDKNRHKSTSLFSKRYMNIHNCKGRNTFINNITEELFKDIITKYLNTIQEKMIKYPPMWFGYDVIERAFPSYVSLYISEKRKSRE